jgi:hypothetical protein
MPSQTNCLRYWDLSSQIRLDDAVALGCNVRGASIKVRTARQSG